MKSSFRLSAALLGAAALLAAAASACAAELPSLPDVVRPSPEPAPPAGFTPFHPPTLSSAAPLAPEAPAVAEWTRTGGPGQTLALTGEAFSRYAGTGAGKDARFLTFGQRGLGSKGTVSRCKRQQNQLS